MLPGLSLALWLRKEPTPYTLVTDAILWSVLLDTAIFWMPPLQRIPLNTWFWLMVAMSCVGLISLATRLKLVQKSPPKPGRLAQAALGVTTFLLFAFYIVIAIVRPNVEWDAVNYYLFVAVGFAKVNHVAYILPASLTLASNAPMSLPPIVPVLYALAISLASVLHVTADQTVRFLPLVFMLGTWAATRRLAATMLSPFYANVAALLFLTLPALTWYMTENPLYLDLAVACFLSIGLADFVTGDQTFSNGLRVGAACMLLLLTKVTGLPILCLAVFGILLFHIGGIRAKALFVALLALLLTAGSKLGFVSMPLSFWNINALTMAFMVVLYAIPRRGEPWRFSREFISAVVICLIPAVIAIVKTSQLVGSPVAFYLPDWTHIRSPNWEWAWKTIRDLHVFDTSEPPGLQLNAGLGLLLWWGFAPLTNILCIVGIVVALQRQLPLRLAVALLALYVLAWLTIFHSNEFHNAFQFREFTEFLFIEPIFAAYVLYLIFREDKAWASVCVSLVLLLTAPFAWVGQETFFKTPDNVLARFGLTQWLGLSSATLANILVFLILAGVLVAFIRWSASQRRPLTPREKKVQIIISGVVAACAVVLIFEPVVATGISPGFSAQYATVRDNEIYGYLPALDRAIGTNRGSSVLTFVGYGVTWFSLGRYRWVDLTDALALGLLKPVLEDSSAVRLIGSLTRLGIATAILPVPGTPFGDAYPRLRDDHRLRGLSLFEDPLIVRTEKLNWWYLDSLYDTTDAEDGATRVFAKTKSGGEEDLTKPWFDRSPFTSLTIVGGANVETNPQVTISGVVHFVYSVQSDRPFTLAITQGDPANLTLRWNGLLARICDNIQRSPSEINSIQIKSIELRYIGSAGSQRTVNWRASDFRITPGGVILRSDVSVFVTHPELAPVAVVNVGRLDSHPAQLYPVLASGEGPSTLQLSLFLRTSPLCQAGEAMVVTFTGTTKTKSRAHWMLRAWKRQLVGRAGSYVIGSIPAPADSAALRGGAPLQISVRRVSVRGVRPTCAISEELDSDALVLSNTERVWQFLGGSRALALHSLDVRRTFLAKP